MATLNNRTLDDTSGEAFLTRDRKNSTYNSMNTSFAERSPHFTKRNQQLIDPTDPPFKRPKISSFDNSIHAVQKNRNGQYLRTVLATGFNPDPHRDSFHAAFPNRSARKNYLKESGIINSLRDFGENTQFRGASGATLKLEAGKLPPIDRYRSGVGFTHSNLGESGTPFSRTPSPSVTQGYEDSDPALPPTPERPRDRSPGSKRRDFEAIFSSGSRKINRQTGSDHRRGSPYQTPGVGGVDRGTLLQPKNSDEDSLSRSTNKARDTLVERRYVLRREIKALEDELLIESRKDNIKRYLKPNRINTDISKTMYTSLSSQISPHISNALSVSSTGFLKINNENVAVKAATLSESDIGNVISSSILPLKTKFWLPLAQLFCPLSFTKHDANTPPSTSRSPIPTHSHQIIQGFSHESLLHFRFLIVLTKFEKPEICEINVECSDWARRELGPSLQRFSNERNILKSLYAISSFMRVARHRAEVWASLRQKFGHLDILQNHAFEVNSMANNAKPEECSPVDRRQLVTNLSRRIIKFRGIHISDEFALTEISLGWYIKIDSSGEAHSHVFTVAKLLSCVNDVDEAKVAQEISDLLNALISEYGIMEGVSRLLESLFRGL
ncbi:hypothetical protein AA313_de0202698 [Arthrobotrys entomopaga]|nr:hypothetical protein AA313_de0202698 [Arthrobotrys entomopaga]